MSQGRTNSDFLNGVPELVVLQLLSKRAMYGYELVQAIRSASGERLSFGEGCIYPILHRLEGQGFLTSRNEMVNGRNRVVYHVTKDGGGRLARSAAHWAQVVQAVNGILFGDRHEQPVFA